MQKLTYNGKLIGEYTTRAEALVVCFERSLVYDNHSRQRNRLLPGVRIEGTDEADGIHGGYTLAENLPIQPSRVRPHPMCSNVLKSHKSRRYLP